MTAIEDDEPVDLPPRIEFPETCPRCAFKHARGKACPRCADTSDLDTGWNSAYSIPTRKRKHKGGS